MAELVDRAYIEVNGEVIDAISIDEKLSGNKEPVKVMNRRNRPIGHRHGVPEIPLTIEFPMDLDLQSRFRRMMAANTRFTSTVEYQGENGTTTTCSYLDCEVYEVGVSSKEGDNTTITLEVQALDWVES